MRMVDIIIKKRDKKELTTEEIQFFINGYNQGSIPDYQASALLMAIYVNKMNKQETADLAVAMATSGDTISFGALQGIKVDKHSSGGVGDKTTLLLAPMVAACGLPVPKMSGRGLGFSGGTIDKLESISGLRTDLSEEEFHYLLNKNNLSIIAQTGNIAPADKKLYALRDVTGTVENLSLIASSIMSKKLATATDAIVLDVKAGSGAFMKDVPQAIALAEAMVAIGVSAGKKMVAVVTNMNQPLGYAVGNALEVKEAIAALHGQAPDDLLELCYVLGSHMLVLGEIAHTLTEARYMLEDVIVSGAAYQKFLDFVIGQGGDGAQIKNPSLLPTATYQSELRSEKSGLIAEINAEIIGQSCLAAGAGRNTKDDVPDLAAGIELHVKVGEEIEAGEILCVVHASSEEKMLAALNTARRAFVVGELTNPQPMVFATVTERGVEYA